MFFPRVVLGAAIVAASFSTGCKEEPKPGKLFEEDGAYELVQFDLDGSGYQEIQVQSREAAFLLKLDAKAKVAQTAMCAENEDDDPETSLCRLASGDDSFWFCHCYAYAFVEDQMQWREFQAGDVPPKVEFMGTDDGATPATGTGGSGSGGGTGVDPAADTMITLTIDPAVNGQYEFTPLPVDIFGSDGMLSRYKFLQKAPSVFDQVFEDPDGRMGCQPCVP